eukprot:GHVO01057878.1.p1 GENE.GHVO01057878.1~~GHVO01057878.1.p1  ORF type:complete len:434 (+),score=8.77 GHVO01057878.1:250-1551(+)
MFISTCISVTQDMYFIVVGPTHCGKKHSDVLDYCLPCLAHPLVPPAITPQILPPAITPQTLRIQDMKWNINMFQLDKETNGHSLFAVTKFHVDNLNPSCINYDEFTRFLVLLESQYHDNPYHGRQHAALVVHHTACISNTIGLTSMMTPLETFSLLIAAAGHDVGHPALTNDHLAKSHHPWASMYKKSALEHCHASSVIDLLERYSVLRDPCSQDKETMDNIILYSILATDLSTHDEYLKMCSSKRRELGSNFSTPDKIWLMAGVLKAADIAYVSMDTNLAEDWTYRLYNEFWAQGDKESKLGLTISPLCDRRNVEGTPNFFLSTQRFMTIIAAPLVFELCRLELVIKTNRLSDGPIQLVPNQSDIDTPTSIPIVRRNSSALDIRHTVYKGRPRITQRRASTEHGPIHTECLKAMYLEPLRINADRFSAMERV